MMICVCQIPSWGAGKHNAISKENIMKLTSIFQSIRFTTPHPRLLPGALDNS
jgi:hypothetical protein